MITEMMEAELRDERRDVHGVRMGDLGCGTWTWVRITAAIRGWGMRCPHSSRGSALASTTRASRDLGEADRAERNPRTFA
jgi:hypothetical protein